MRYWDRRAREQEGEARVKNKKIDLRLAELDFLTGGLSYAELAEKHGVSVSTVRRRAAEGHWKERLRRITEQEDGLRQKEQETEVVICEELALEIRQQRRLRMQETVDRMLEKLRDCVEELGPEDVYALASLIRAMKDLRELQGLQKDSLDLAEQQARIDKLRSEIRRGESESSSAGVLILPEIRETEE